MHHYHVIRRWHERTRLPCELVIPGCRKRRHVGQLIHRDRPPLAGEPNNAELGIQGNTTDVRVAMRGVPAQDLILLTLRNYTLRDAVAEKDYSPGMLGKRKGVRICVKHDSRYPQRFGRYEPAILKNVGCDQPNR